MQEFRDSEPKQSRFASVEERLDELIEHENDDTSVLGGIMLLDKLEKGQRQLASTL